MSSTTLQSAFSHDPVERRAYGRYYTPQPIRDALHRLLLEALRAANHRPEEAILVDPSCGPGTFLCAPEARRYRRRLGLDLDRQALAAARAAIPDAEIFEGDAYRDGLETLLGRIEVGHPVAVIGNPPYVANSALLQSSAYHEVRDRLLPFARDVARGTSIRDDYALFFGVADHLVNRAGSGAIAFVTSASFIDNFLYAPMRRWLLSRYRLVSLVELGGSLFPGTRVTTALSVWVRTADGQGSAPFGHLRLEGSVPERLARLGAEQLALNPATPHGPHFLLNAPRAEALGSAGRLKQKGAPIGTVVQYSLAGLKTRFEKLLVDENREALERRMGAFFEATDPAAFAEAHGLRASSAAKLAALFEARSRTRFDAAAIRPYARYAGRSHRFKVPESAQLWAYVDPALIPRGDHRFQPGWDPHREGPKLVFNVREVPLSAAVVEGGACVHDYRHARFAPLRIPARFGASWAAAGRANHGRNLSSFANDSPPQAPDEPVLNFSPEWAALARRLREPADLFHFICAVVNSRLIQEHFAPWLGATEEVPIPLAATKAPKVVQQVADVARKLGAGADLPARAETAVRALFSTEAGGSSDA